MATIDLTPQNTAPDPLDLLTNAASPHGYGVGKDGQTAAFEVKVHAPKINTSPNPTHTDTEIVSDITQLFTSARNYRRPMVGVWKRCKRMLYNKQSWSRERPDWLPSPLIPEIMPICAALVGWMTDQRIGYTVAPTAIPHSDYFDFFQTLALDLETVMDATWQVNSEENEWTKVMWDAVTYGTGIIKTTWDMTLAGGQGDAISRRVSPFSFYPDPQATSFEDANYFIEAKQMSVQELDRRYPGAQTLFPSGGFGNLQDIEPTQLDDTGSKSSSSTTVTLPNSNTTNLAQGGGNRTDCESVLVLEAWIREHEVYTTTDQQSGESEDKVFDTWRVVVVAGNHVIMDEPADNLWSHGKHPYSRLVLWDKGADLWGKSLVELLTPTQVMINRLLAALQQNIELTGNPVFKQAVSSPNARTTLTNKPGMKVAVNPGDANSGWMNPPAINPVMMQLLQYYLQRMEEISGLSGIAKGQSPGGRPAQGVVDSLQESVFVRVRQHLKYLEYAMRDAGFKRASLICENYTGPRMMAIAGPSGERTSLVLKSRHFLVPTSKGAMPLQYALNVDAGSRMHTSRAMREERAIQLFTMGIIDRDAALDDLKYPNATVVAERMNAHEQEMAAAGAQAAPGARQRAGH